MTGLISSPVPAPDPEAAQVVADGWFPPIALADVRDRLRLGEGTVSTARLTEAIEGGMVHALRELAQWRAARVLDGAGELADVTTDQLNGHNYAVLLWQRVVRYFAGADLAADYRDVSATDQGLDRAAEKDLTSDELRRRALAAVADLRSIGGDPVARNRVELI
ncbi:Phage head completion protein (GPL) [Novosphingobium sp. CF614]|uniref:head completion/stabilization protein n=1 Tax=Novosphingobium sp. CF614 TaxID=1884364 RepID=UPI0008E5A511|nr:head completion/stabilization protein [Novosphingobium sp. CF614]SFG08363.1 Phage head completion protein (GPL) [Novosphingobium sp. CF614]